MNNKKMGIIFFMPNMDLQTASGQLSKGLFGAKGANLFLLLGYALILSACTFSSARMTAPTFDSIAIGTPITTIEEQAGAPYSVKGGKGGEQTYHYIERIQVGPETTSQNTYVLTVVNGIIVDKQRINESSSINFQYR